MNAVEQTVGIGCGTTWHEVAPRLLSEYLAETGPGEVVEIGVWRGELSRLLLACPDLTRLHLVDPWHPALLESEGKWYACGPGTDVDSMDEAYIEVLKLAVWEPLRVQIHKTVSMEAAKVIPDGSLAVVIVDALHFQNTVMEDIAAWRPKLRPGGLMIGDDLAEYFPGVQLGVEAMFGTQYKCIGQTWWAFPDQVTEGLCGAHSRKVSTPI